MATLDLSENIWERKVSLLVVSLLATLFLAVLYRTAWLCDDAYITYRTVDNAVNGFGLRFNTGERVQSFTHPLWMFLHIIFRFFSDNMYAVGMSVALGTSLLSMGFLLRKLAGSLGAMAFVLLAATFSRAFMDYSTSGLENPLTHLLVGIFAWIWLDYKPGNRKLFWLAFVTGLAVTNRMDTLLLLAPALGLEFWRQRSWRNVCTVAAGLSVFILWEIFSLIYYGFPFPNTAYAKLSHGFESSLMWKQGFYYLKNSFSRDPITLLTIFAAALMVFVYRQKRLIPLVLGMLLYILYVTKIGAGFMSGRFFTGPFFLALIVLVKVDVFPKEIKEQGQLLLAVLLVGWMPGSPTVVSGKAYSPGPKGAIDAHGIADERAFYYPGTGLLHAGKGKTMPTFRWVADGEALAKKPDSVHIAGNMGFLGYAAGPHKHLIDLFGLTDPLLARIPNRFMPDWRPGHFERMVPLGYKKTVETGKNLLKDPALKTLYNDLKLASQSRLFALDRWKAIIRLNLGQSQGEMDMKHYFLPADIPISYSDISTPQSEGVTWNAPENILFGAENGLRIALPKGLDFTRLNTQLCAKCYYIIVFRKNTKRLHSFIIPGLPGQDMFRYCKILPSDLTVQAPDELLIYTLTDWRKCSLRDLQFSKYCPE